jgi:hypothetical protein
MSYGVYGNHSASSWAMFGITKVRNHCPAGSILAEVGYVVTFLVSIVETVVAAVFTLVAALFCSKKQYQFCAKWLSSAAFTIPWSLFNSVYNFLLFITCTACCIRLACDERSARDLAQRAIFNCCDIEVLTTGKGAVFRPVF